MLALIWIAPSAWVRWLSLSSGVVDSGLKLSEPPPNSKEPKQSALEITKSKLPSPTEEEIIKASSVALHRMQPPKPAPPPEQPAIVAAPAVETVLFPGSLIGIIRDSDPAYCYAVLKWPDNRIQLVAKGDKLNENADSACVDDVHEDSVSLTQGIRKQTLEMRGSR